MTHTALLLPIRGSFHSPASLVVRSTRPFHQEGSARRNQARLLFLLGSNQCTPVMFPHDLVLHRCRASSNHLLHPWGSINLINPNLLYHCHRYSHITHSLVPSRRLHHPDLAPYRHKQGHPNHSMLRHRRRAHTRFLCPNNQVVSKALAGDLFLNNLKRPDLRL